MAKRARYCHNLMGRKAIDITMPGSEEFENRRKERRRRERLRKKRIRAVLILILLIGIIVLICAAISAVTHSGSERNASQGNESIITGETPNPDDALIETPAPTDTVPVSQIPDAATENNLIQIIADAGQLKHCYLTFDDGPTENITPQILDVLRRYNVKATFFEVGSLIDANPDMARRVYEEGHLIANHSDSHNYDKLYATENSFITEINTCYDKIKNITNGEEPFRLIRFPGGAYNSGDHASEKQIYKNTLAQNGFYYCDWNTLTGDAEGRTKNAEELLAYLQESMVGFNNIIVLMHDASTKQATADALPSVIEYIASQGYTFHRLDDIDYQTQSAPAVSSSSPEASPLADTENGQIGLQ